jgi:hypothetical protein
LPYDQDFSTGSLPGCWLNVDNQGSNQIWEFDNPGERTISTTTGGNGFAILDSDNYGNGNSQDADLVTPEFDFSGYISVHLEFEYYFRSYSGSSAELFYSTNGGSSWTSIQSWTSSSANPATFSQDMSTEVAGESSVKFKWNYTGSWGYYWIVDDISITGVEGGVTQNQVTTFGSGWNMFSLFVTPSSCNMIDVTQPLIDNGSLVKITNESGGFVQYIPGPGWMNTIGDMCNTEGYYINLANASSLSTSGTPVTFPFDIPLNSGWNIIGYPCDAAQTAMTVLQPLIDNNYLVKVLDETGGLIQYITGVGWINTINTFDPGKGYYVNVNTNCSLTLSDPSKGSDPLPAPEPAAATAYFTNLTGNPFNPMNIVIRDIHTDGFSLEDGDELALFDENIEVGSSVIVVDEKGYQLLTVRSDDPITNHLDGFTTGNELSFRYYDKSEDVIYTNIQAVHISGDKTYTPLGTLLAELEISSLGIEDPDMPATNYLGQNFPNPYSEQTRIKYGISEDAQVILSVFDISGRTVMILENNFKTAGKYTIQISRSSLEAGIYYYRIEVVGKEKKFTESRKMILF